MTEKIYVSIDLETTGTDAKRDTIIEIGAVKFQGDQIIDCFSTLVDPQRSIPLRIQQLTGIRDTDVSGAPSLARALPELLAFVGSNVSALIAHNTAFDLGFLQANGVNFHRPAHDTVDLATILLPGQSSYNLGELCRALDIELVDAHRALDDAKATAHLFIKLHQRLLTLDPFILRTIADYAADTSWSLEPLVSAAADRVNYYRQHDPRNLLSYALSTELHEAPTSLLQDKNSAFESIAIEQVNAVFAPDGPLAAQLGQTFERREGQITMAHQVLHALNSGDHLMVEAGTGIGKSLAYLLPAALWSTVNSRRVVIATNTLTLQEQLLEKDIPQVQALLQAEAQPMPRAAVLKGRSNYLCLRRFLAWCKGRKLGELEMNVLAKVFVWLPTTQTGDVAELGLINNAERAIWDRISSDSATCSIDRCSGTSAEGIPLFDFHIRAHRHAESAHLLVVNHALMLADIAAENMVLPAYSHLIVDEAHHLEDAATDQFTYSVDWAWVLPLLKRLTNDGDLLPSILATAQRFGVMQAAPLGKELARWVEKSTEALQRFARALVHFTRGQDSLRANSGYAQRLALDSSIRSQPQWSEIEVEWDEASDLLHSAGKSCIALIQTLDEARWHTQPITSALLSDLKDVGNQLSELAQQLDLIVFSPESSLRSRVSWLELNDLGNSVTLAVAPAYVGDILEKTIVHGKRSAIFTSATLRANSNFSFVRERLGLWDVPTAIIESPFDYKQSTLLYLPGDLMVPNHANYQPAIERAIIDAAQASEGRLLALFTSYAHLRQTAEAVRSPLDRLGITVLQHGTTSRQRLLREYRATERSVLFGTRSFWEGVDLPGDELRCLVIVKLPFAVPNDPLVAARSADFDDPFNDYTLPDAILRFRQGFGRLIRRASDRGVVLLLDSRLWKREYGQAFLDALPQCTVSHAPLANIAGEVRKWLK